MRDDQVATLGNRLWADFCEMDRYWISAVVDGSLCMVRQSGYWIQMGDE